MSVDERTRDREGLRDRFLSHHGISPDEIDALPQDASGRRYFRIRNSARPMLLMDAPPPGEDVHPFVRIADHLSELGTRPPKIYERDLPNGFLLLEDFGRNTFTHLLDGGAASIALYKSAIDVLIKLHQQPDARRINLPNYDHQLLIEEALLFTDWFYPARYKARIDADVRQGFITAWREVLSQLPDTDSTLVLRDFHVDNLMQVSANGSKEFDCGLLDFQDAVIGPRAYDVMSLLEDARRDVDHATTGSILDRYYQAIASTDSSFDRSAFERWYRCLAVQRHAKVLGIFMRLYVRDGKDIYLKHLPRVARLFILHLAHDDLEPIRRWVEANVPSEITPIETPSPSAILPLTGP